MRVLIGRALAVVVWSGGAPGCVVHAMATPACAPQAPPVPEPAPPPKPPVVVETPVDGAPGRAVQAALQWLARHQEENGSWDCDGFMKHDKTGKACDGAGKPLYDVGVTGLALLAFLEAGAIPGTEPHGAVVQKGLAWLVGQQKDGLIGSAMTHDYVYGHAIATQALALAARKTGDLRWLDATRLAVVHLLKHRNPYAVWRYHPRDNENDVSVTAWCAAACKAGEAAGCDVDPDVWKYVTHYLDDVADPSGVHGYTRKGEAGARLPGGHHLRFPPEKGAALTAAAVATRRMLGEPDSDLIRAAVARIVERPPSDDREAVDYYYWYFASKALRATGGRHFRDWQLALNRFVLRSQRKDGNRAGSWDPIDVWGEVQGRVGSTALASLTLLAAFASPAVR